MPTDQQSRGPAPAGGAHPTVKAETPTRMRLFCLPPAGSGAMLYRSWPKAAPAWIDCRPVDLPGRERRLAEPAETRAEILVARLANELAAELEPPFALFGHSMGGLLAFELARELRRRGRPAPAGLFLSAFPAPSQVRKAMERPLHGLAREDLLDELAALGGTPPEVLANADLMNLMLPTIRADLSVCETWRYDPEPPLETSIRVLAGRADERCPPKQMSGWSAETTGDFELRVFEGNHFFLRPCLSDVIEFIETSLKALKARQDKSRRPVA